MMSTTVHKAATTPIPVHRSEAESTASLLRMAIMQRTCSLTHSIARSLGRVACWILGGHDADFNRRR